MPAVSVIIPAYNQSHYLAEAIQSVLGQTYPDFEIIVVDDGSTDDTPAVAKRFNDPRVRYIYQENRGLSGARNTGIRNSVGEYLTYLDSDDLFSEEKLALLVEELEKNQSIGFVAGQAIPIDENGRRVGKIFNSPPPEDIHLLLIRNPFHVGSVMLRRSWQEKAGEFDEKLRSYEDWDMWLRLALAGCSMGWVAQPVSYYRFHSAQMTRIGAQMTAATFAVLDKFFTNPALPGSWEALHDQAYSHAYLRAAAQAYNASDCETAKTCLERAVDLNPELLNNNADQLAGIFNAWTDLPKTGDPLAFAERIYNNLPESLAPLQRQRRKMLGQAAVRAAFSAYHHGDMKRTRHYAVRGMIYSPEWLLNQGVWSILVHSFIN
jgi:hypothetical protein